MLIVNYGLWLTHASKSRLNKRRKKKNPSRPFTVSSILNNSIHLSPQAAAVLPTTRGLWVTIKSPNPGLGIKQVSVQTWSVEASSHYRVSTFNFTGRDREQRTENRERRTCSSSHYPLWSNRNSGSSCDARLPANQNPSWLSL